MAIQLRMLHDAQYLVEEELEGLNYFMLDSHNAERLGDYHIQQRNLQRILNETRTTGRLLDNVDRFVFEERRRVAEE